MNGNPWTQSELDIIKTERGHGSVHVQTVLLAAGFPRRSLQTIRTKTRKMGYSLGRPTRCDANHNRKWQPEEDAILQSVNGRSVWDMSRALAEAGFHRDEKPIRSRAQKLELTVTPQRKQRRWAQPELDILHLSYPAGKAPGTSAALIRAGFFRTLCQIRNKAAQLRLTDLPPYHFFLEAV